MQNVFLRKAQINYPKSIVMLQIALLMTILLNTLDFVFF
jgi:hypothetical protein